MSVSKISGVRIAGVASAVPDHPHSLLNEIGVFGTEEIEKISDSTGVVRRYISPDGMCTSDLCFSAAGRLLRRRDGPAIRWTSSSSSPRPPTIPPPPRRAPSRPASACPARRVRRQPRLLRLRLRALDRGEPGGGGGSGPFLVVRHQQQEDLPRTAPFACCSGTPERPRSSKMAMRTDHVLRPDGLYRADNLIIPGALSGFPTPDRPANRWRGRAATGGAREDLYMNGAEIFSFTLREVPPLIKSVLGESGWSMEEVDSFVFHQANKFMLDFLAQEIEAAEGPRSRRPRDGTPVRFHTGRPDRSPLHPVGEGRCDWSSRGSGSGIRRGRGAVIAMPEMVMVPDSLIQAVSTGAPDDQPDGPRRADGPGYGARPPVSGGDRRPVEPARRPGRPCGSERGTVEELLA